MYVYIYVHKYVCVCTSTYICIYIHISIYIYTHTCAYVCLYALASSRFGRNQFTVGAAFTLFTHLILGCFVPMASLRHRCCSNMLQKGDRTWVHLPRCWVTCGFTGSPGPVTLAFPGLASGLSEIVNGNSRPLTIRWKLGYFACLSAGQLNPGQPGPQRREPANPGPP